MKCTEKNPLDRYRHASDVLSALVNYEDETTPYLVNNAGGHDKTTVSPVAATQAEENQGAAAPAGETPAEPAKKKRRKWPWVLFILLFLLAAAAIITYLMWPRQAPTVDLQDLQNMTVAEAEEYLASEELLLGEISEEYNDNFEEGFIIETTPVSGVTIERGQPVDILVSLGEEPYTMKDYVGDDYTEVTSELETLGFNIEIQGEYSEEPVDSILEQSLEAGEEVYPENENLTFTVSQGLEPISITNYAGTQLETARAELESNGFIVEVTMEMYSDDVPEGAVVSQSPNYGDFLPGSLIEIIVSLGPEPPDETTYRVSLDIPYPEDPEAADSSEDKKEDKDDKDPKPLEAVIYIDDKDNEFSEEAETLEITEDTTHSIQLILLDGEPGRYRVEVDGKEVISETIENE